VPGFRQTVTAYFEALTALGMRLLQLLALSLGLPAGYFAPYFTHPMIALRPLHYTAEVRPPGASAVPAMRNTKSGAVRNPVHSKPAKVAPCTATQRRSYCKCVKYAMIQMISLQLACKFQLQVSLADDYKRCCCCCPCRCLPLVRVCLVRVRTVTMACLHCWPQTRCQGCRWDPCLLLLLCYTWLHEEGESYWLATHEAPCLPFHVCALLLTVCLHCWPLTRCQGCRWGLLSVWSYQIG
jgi:hypothetical protein